MSSYIHKIRLEFFGTFSCAALFQYSELLLLYICICTAVAQSKIMRQIHASIANKDSPAECALYILCLTVTIGFYCIASSMNKLCSVIGYPSAPSCPLGTTHCIPQGKFPRKPYNYKSFIEQTCLIKMAGCWPRSSFLSLWTSTSSWSINTQKKNLANIQSF